MRILKTLLLCLLVVIAALVVIAFFLPKTAHVERSVTIARPPSQVFALLSNLHRFNAWSPWFDLDPQAKYTFSGPLTGVGAKSSWTGNKDVGSGSQEIIESRPNELVKTQLDFGAMGRPTASFKLVPAGLGTTVTWSLDQSFEGSLIGRYFGLMLDSMVGKDYDKGLTRLKALVESFPAADISGISGTPVDLTAKKIYFVSVGPIAVADMAATSNALAAAYARIGALLRANKLEMTGPLLTITTSYDATTGWQFDAAAAVAANDAPGTDEVKAGTTYAGRAVQFVHVGPYDKLGDTIMKAHAWLAVQGYKPKDRLIEEYLSDPGNTPPEQLQTRLTIPVEP
jgi:effector-binding domain-containing protein/uncharacterized protein YndB with AHSA1/START domain